MKIFKRRYKIGTGRNPEKLKFNHCSALINQDIYSIYEFKIGTIEHLKDQKRSNREKELLDRKTFKKNKPMIKTIEDAPDFEPALSTYAKKDVKLIKNNNLFFFSVVKDGKIEKKVSTENIHEKEFIQKSLPRRTKIVFDINNMRVKLMGEKTFKGWVKVDKVPLYKG